MLTGLDSRHEKMEWYEELCALDAIGELSMDEARDLRLHLQTCPACRALHNDFCRLASDDLGMAASRRDVDTASQKSGEQLQDEQELLSRVLQTAQRRRRDAACFSPQPAGASVERIQNSSLRRRFSYLRPAVIYGAIAVSLFTSGGLILPHFKKPAPAAATTPIQTNTTDWKNQPERAAAERRSEQQARLLRQSEFEREQLERRMAGTQAKYEALLAEDNKKAEELATLHAGIDKLNNDLSASRETQDQKDKLLENFELKLHQAELRAEEERAMVASLEWKLRAAEQESARTSVGTDKEFDSRNLLGARDLHIVDVYDVDSSGKNRRTYGRVFYIEKKLLVFYAFDLEGKKRNRAVGGFQAWGYRQPNASKPEDLGLFTVEDAKLNRWVLTVNDSRILERIDAVFVTAEPGGGSPSPRGRKVLYANLAGPPNHP